MQQNESDRVYYYSPRANYTHRRAVISVISLLFCACYCQDIVIYTCDITSSRVFLPIGIAISGLLMLFG